MSTELDLSDMHRSHQPDPAFVAQLEQRLDAILADDVIDSPVSDEGGVEMDVIAPLAARRRSRLSVVLGAAAAVTLVAAGIVMWRQQDPAEFASTEQDPSPTEVLGTVAPPTPTAPAPTAAPVTVPAIVDPWLGIWLSTDTDGSNQTMQVNPVGAHDYEIVIHDDATIACSGPPATITGTGQLTNDETLMIPQAELTCDDGAIPVIGLPPQPDFANFTFVMDPETDQLIDPAGVVWWREWAEGALPTSITVPSPEGDSFVVTGVPTANQQAAVSELIGAVNSMAADADADISLPDLFAEGAVISPIDDWALSPITDTATIEAWIQHLRAWGFEADETTQECWTEEGRVFCPVRTHWDAVLAEADQYWTLDFDGDRIRSLTVAQPGKRYGDPVLPLSITELDRWEEWLLQTDPDTAARLIPDDNSAQPRPVVPRYDPALADEITISIQMYLDQRGPGDEITVTDDMIQLGYGLVGTIGNMDRADGRTYVIAGRYETEIDLMFPPDEGVLAAFDDTGAELWRTDLSGGPSEVVAVDGYLWVMHGSGLTQFDAANGTVVGQIANPSMDEMVGAFGSLWVKVNDGDDATIELLRIDSDRSTTTVELPQADTPDAETWPHGLAEGPDAIWVPLDRGGVARVDADTLEVTVVSAEEISHPVTHVAVDNDVVYVASSNRITSIVDGQVVATASLPEFWYLGHVEGVFGIMQPNDRFMVIQPTDPMIVEVRPVNDGGGAGEVDGETWAEIGWNYSLHRVEFLDDPGGDGG